MRVALADSMPIYRAEASRQLAEAYAALLAAAGGRLPPKSRLDVTQLARAVPHLVLCAVTRPDRCIYRLAGEDVKGRIGRNPVGLNYYDFVAPERRAHAMRAINMLIDVPCAFRAEIEQTYSDDFVRLVEAVAFPLESEQPDVDGFVLFAESALGPDQRTAGRGALLVRSNVIRRDLIDIGFGVNETFEDLVPVEE
jgi:hypothetical protein